MEKISIARRRLEKKAAVYVKKPNDSPSDTNCATSGENYSTPAASSSPPEASCPTPEASCPTPGASYPASEASCPPQEASPPPQEMNNNPQQSNSAALQTPPVYSLDSLISLINEEGGLLELGKKQFTLEIVSGVEKPIKMLVSIHPVDENSNSSGRASNYEEGYVTPEEAAQVLKVSKNTIYRQLKEGSLKGLKIGCRWRVLLSPQGKTEGSERGNG